MGDDGEGEKLATTEWFVCLWLILVGEIRSFPGQSALMCFLLGQHKLVRAAREPTGLQHIS